MSDSQSLVFQEVEEQQTAHAVERPSALTSSRPPLQPSSASRGVPVQPLVAIKPKKKITTTPSINSEDSIQFIAVPSRNGSAPVTPKHPETSPPPRPAAVPQRPRVAPRSRAESVHSVGSSIQFNVDDSNMSTGPAHKSQHHSGGGSDREGPHYYNSHANASSRPPLTNATNRPVRKPSTNSTDIEESIAFQDADNSSHSSSMRGHGASEVPNDSIAFQMVDDDGASGHAGASQSFPRIFKPLHTAPHNDRSPEESLAFDVEDAGASWSRGPSPRVPPQPPRSPSPQFLNNDSIAFQFEDSVPRAVEHHSQAPPLPTTVPSPGNDREAQSLIFQLEDSARADSVHARSPVQLPSPRNDAEADGKEEREKPVKAKKTVVSNRLQKLSRSSSPAKPSRDVFSPPSSPAPVTSPSDRRADSQAGAESKEGRSSHRKKSGRTRKEDGASGSGTPGVDPSGAPASSPADVDMPRKRHRSSKSGEHRRSSRSDGKRKHRRHTRDREEEDTSRTPSASDEARAETTGGEGHRHHHHTHEDHQMTRETSPQENVHHDSRGTRRSGSSDDSVATTKTETDTCAGSGPLPVSGRQETAAFHSRVNSSTIVVHQPQPYSGVGESDADVFRSLVKDEGYQHQVPFHRRNETAVYHNGSGNFPSATSAAGANPSQAVPGQCTALMQSREDVERATQEAAYWSAFNAAQRQELQQLQSRIRAARRQDRTLLERSLEVMTRPAVNPQPGGYAAATGSQTTFRWKHGKPVGAVAAADAPVTRTSLSSPIPRRRPPPSSATHASTPRHTSATGGLSRSPRLNTSKTARDKDNAAAAHAQEAVAEMLGVLWPPSRPNELFFLSGTRLTPSQVQRFYETVEVHKRTGASTAAAAGLDRDGATYRSASRAKAEARRVAHYGYMSPTQLRRSASPDGYVTSREASEAASPLPLRATNRKTMKRSQVLRDIFNLMDTAKTGLVHGENLGTLHHLLEQELAALESLMTDEAAGGDGLGVAPCEPCPANKPQGLIATAAAQRELYEKAWKGLSREVAVLDAVSSAASENSFLSTRAEVARQAAQQRQALRLSLAVNVVIPLCRTSGIGAFDFPTTSLLVFAALDRAQAQSTPQGQAWHEIVCQYFVMLS